VSEGSLIKKSIFALEEGTRKKEIIDISLRIVDKRGIKGLTVARIAKEAGFVESALYRHFRSKKEIISLILDSVLLDARSHFKKVKEMSLNAIDALKILLKIHLEFLEAYPGIFRIIYSDEIHLGENFLLEKLHLFTNELIKSIKKIISQGIKESLFKANVDASLAAIHFLGIVQTAFTFWTIKNRKLSLIKIGEDLLSQFFEGIKA